MDNLSQDKLKELESKCIQEEEPWCNAMCPIHVDGRQLCKFVAEGNFTEGRKLYEKKVVFPNIISRICEEQCKSQCKRKELGNSINIRQLELACMNYGKSVKARVLLKPKKKEKVIIFGTSLSGLTCAVELKNKGYLVDLHEKEDVLGYKIYEDYKGILEGDIIKDDLKKVETLGVNIHLNSSFDKNKLEELKKNYDVIVIDGNVYNEHLTYNMITLQHKDKVFYIPRNLSAVECIGLGKRVSTSVDRFFQKSSMTQGREKEGVFQTKLYTNLEDVEIEDEILPSNKKYYTEDEAIKEGKRCIDCNCLECMKGCEFLRNYNSYPKKMAREAYNNLAIALGNRTSNKMIDSCSLCGQCGAICPGGLDLGEVLEYARNQMVKTDKMPPSAFEFAIDDMEFSNSEEFFTVIEKENLNYVFFPGCQLCASEPDLVKVIYNDLNSKLNDEVGMILGCCGVIAKWSGNSEKFKEQIDLIQSALKKINNPLLITACPTCYKIFNSNLKDIKIKMIYDYIDNNELNFIGDNEEIAIDDPCTARYDEKLQEQVREIARELGFNVKELDYNREEATCCGYGGLTCFSNKELKDNIVSSRINQSKLNYLTYCINCRDNYLSQNKDAKHILQLIYNFDGKNKKPNISERRYNRVQLKIDLTHDNKKNDYDIELIMSDEVKEKLEDRMILNKDIEDTIIHGEKTKEKFINKTNNHSLAYLRIKNVTFWVEYSIEENKYQIYNAYSHRMEIEVN